MASHRDRAPSTSPSISSDDTVNAGGLLNDHDFAGPEKMSMDTSAFEKHMAIRASAAVYWARAALAKVNVSRRPTRHIVALIALLYIFFTILHLNSFAFWSAAPPDDFAIRGHYIPNNIWQ